MENRYYINKLGLINFWYYDIEEFNLEHGNLLLRGSNGSGKSVTMQSFIPLLLDGNKSPERLDPFGTKARTISNYLLEEDDNEKTAYLYMEFKKGKNENYITIGIGFKAIKNKPVQSWYFILSDGRRIGKDMFLYRDAGELIPLTKKQLENELGEGNFYTESQKTYMEMVNKYLFGFDDIESYEELLNLLISIRSPKLSKDFKPTEIYKILEDSLKVLSDEDLRPISDSMENMDSLKDALDENKRALKAVNNIKYHYDRYNTAILLEKCRKLMESYKKLNESIKAEKEKNNAFKKYIKEIEIYNADLIDKEHQLKVAEEKYEKLVNREEYKSKKELAEIQINLKENRKSKNTKENALESKKAKEREISFALKDISSKKDSTFSKLKEALIELEEYAGEINLVQCMGTMDKGLDNVSNDDFDYYEKNIKEFEKKLKDAEKYFKEYESQKERLFEVVKTLDELKKDDELEKKNMQRAEELLLTEKENYKVHVNTILENNTLYVLEEHEKLQLLKEIDTINDYDNIQECKNLLNNFLNEKINDKDACIKIDNKMIEDYLKEIKNINKEIEELKNNKDIEPERSEGVKKNRERLKSLNIDFIPLYKAIDFRKDLSEKVKSHIEGSLYNMGLLDALIISEKDKEAAMNFEKGMEDKYIFSNPNILSFNLSNMLNIDKSLKGDKLYNEIDNVLQSIFLEKSGTTYLDEKGYFKIGIMGGKSNDNYSQKYIGEASRKRHREILIKEKENIIKEKEDNITKHKKSIEYLQNDINILNNEYNTLPQFHGISEALKILKDLESKLKKLDDEIIKYENKKFEEEQKLKDIKLKIMDNVRGLEEIKCLNDVEDALDAVSDYKEVLTKGKINLNDLRNAEALLKSQENVHEDTLKDIDNLYYEINILNKKIQDNEIKEASIQEALSKVNMQEIEAEIDYCLKIKNENPDLIKNLSNSIGKMNSSAESLEKEIETIKKEIDNNEKEYKVYEKIFNEEYNLEYVCKKEQGEVSQICSKLMAELTSDNEKNREFYSNNLTAAINKNGADLREYAIKEISLFSDEEFTENNKWLRERRDFKGKIQGKEVNLLVLLNEIQRSIDELQLLISEEERKVFEEVLMNTISGKVNAKIYQSTAWVKKINDLMNTMDTSSSLKLNLAWIPKKAESEGQLDISKLKSILERGDRNSESDLQSLAKHFSEKVKEELRSYEGSGEARNYHSIIKDVLDYRKWYEFKLYYVKNNERKKELTNNAFFQFSGGEKAMSMYIPLFSAIYARYEKGRKDCPRIISMDEAFAGVDENNIRDMFRLLKELDLNYILNSQILWGDYDTVDSLSICELIREENDDVVTVLKYLWNGKEKVLLNE